MIEDIEALLAQYKQYLLTGRKDLKGFGHWLVQEDLKTATLQAIADYEVDIDRYYNGSNNINQLYGEVSMLWGHLDRYKHMLVKSALADMPVNNTEEFVLLLYIDIYQKPRMKDFVKDSLMEVTTCFEMMKRMKKRGLIAEETDPTDRRSKLIYLTDAGKDAAALAKVRMSKVNEILYHNVTAEELRHIKETFRALAGYHERVHQYLQRNTFEDLAKDPGAI